MPLPRMHLYKQSDETVDVILHGGSVGFDSPFMRKVFDRSVESGQSALSFNFPYMDRGEDQSSGEDLEEECVTLRDILDLVRQQLGFRNIRFIAKSFGAIVLSRFLKQPEGDEYRAADVVVLGYVLGDVDLEGHEGQITVIQGEKDKFGDAAAVQRDLARKNLTDVKVIEIPGADHSYRDPETKQPLFEDQAIQSF